jgi:lysophospholipid acyltransferase
MSSSLLTNIYTLLSEDQFRLIISILITFPIGYLNHYIKGITPRLLYGLIFGVLVQFFMYGYAAIHIFIGSMICFLIMKSTSEEGRKNVGWIITIYVFTHMSIIHIYRMITDYGGWTMDVSGIFMMTVCKFSSFAFCYSDGGKVKFSALSERGKKYAVESFTILEYFSYIYFYTSCVMGPFHEYSDFINFIKKENEYKNIPIDSALAKGLNRLSLGIVIGFIYLSVKKYISVDYYFAHPLNDYIPNIVVFYLFIMQKYKFYTGFLFAESIAIVSGLSYQKVRTTSTSTGDEYEDNFEKVKNINVAIAETTTCVQTMFQNWNISVHKYLKSYIHFRIIQTEEDRKNKSKVNFAKAVTFMVSALWHGFYPAYYIVFGHFILGMFIENNVKYIKENISESVFVNKILTLYVSVCYLTYEAFLFGILDALEIPKMFKFMASVYFIPSIIILCSFYLTNKCISNHLKKCKKTDK